MLRLGLLICMVISLMTNEFVFAHGTVTSPPSRVWNCYQENPENPSSAPCIAAVASHGPQPLYDWNEINQGDANGQHIDLIQDGNLASGGRPIKYGGMDLVSMDWVATPVSAGPFTVTWTNTAPHATSYYEVYITNADWTPAQPLTWGSLTLLVRTDPSVAESTTNIPVTLPARLGKHVIYSIWQRSDSGEAFYSTSDIDFGTAALSVDLTAFNASLLDENKVDLSWTTASEVNNAYFAVEYSSDGIDFKELGRVVGNGTTQDQQDYSFVDKMPMNGKNYYRLRQVDYDGKVEYSSIETVNILSNIAFEIYPTLASDFIQVRIKEDVKTDIEFQIFDVAGRSIQFGRIESNVILFNCNIADFDKGAYFIRLSIEGEIVTKQFVKI